MSDWLMDTLVAWLGKQVVGRLSDLLELLTASLFISPDVTILPQVQQIATRSGLVVSACFGLAIVAVGAAVMVGDSVQTKYQLKELLPRLVTGFVLSVFAVPLTGVLIEIANALTVSMVGQTAPTSEAIEFVQFRLESALADDGTAFLMTVIGLLIVVLLFMLVTGWLVRIGMLIVLAGIAPVALACYATPWTQAAAGLWWRTLLGCLATPTLQAIAFSVGINLLLDPTSNLPVVVGVPGTDTFNLIVVVVVLWTSVKIPSLVGRYAGGPGGRPPNLIGFVTRTISSRGLGRGGGSRPQTSSPKVDLSTHTHHHYRRLRRVHLNRSAG